MGGTLGGEGKEIPIRHATSEGEEGTKHRMTSTSSGNGLTRRLGLASVTSIVIANMIGAGIFTTSGLLMTDLKSPALMLVLWVIGGIIALCGALCYGELGAAIPRAGGEYAILTRLYHPAVGFLSGWVSLFAGFSAPIAASAIGVSEYIVRAFPNLASTGASQGMLGAVDLRKGIAIAVIVLFTLLHRRALEVSARIQNILTVLKVVLVVGLVMLGFAVGGGDWTHVLAGFPTGESFPGWRTTGLALMWILFAYSGWNAAAYVGSEVRDPQRNLPRALLFGTAVVTAIYLAVNLLYVYAVPPNEMGGVISIAALAVAKLAGSRAASAVSLLVAFALFSSLSAYMILGPRVYYAMAVDGVFFKFAGRVHPRFGVPSQSVVLQGMIAVVMVQFGTFDQILTYMGFSLGLFPLLAVFGVFKLRRRGNAQYLMPAYPIAPLVYLIAGVSILILAFLERPAESSIAIGMVLLGLPAWFLFRAHADRASKTGP